MAIEVRKFREYYWIWFKHLGQEVARSGWADFKISFALSIITFLVGWLFRDGGAMMAFEIAVIANFAFLAMFGVAHIVRSPWLLHKENAVIEVNNKHWGLGVFGIFVVVLTLSVIAGWALLLHFRLQPDYISIPSPDSGAKIAMISQLQQQNAVLEERLKDLRKPTERVPSAAEQLNSARPSQASPGSPPPTFRERILAINAHLTEGDRNRFSNALSEFSDSLNQGGSIGYKLNSELGGLNNAENSGAIAGEVQAHEKVLSDIAAEGWKYQKAFPALRAKWDMFREQNTYIFGDNPDNEGPNAIINAAEGYRNYLALWDSISNKNQKPVLNLLSVQRNESQARLAQFFKWQRGCVERVEEMRNSIR